MENVKATQENLENPFGELEDLYENTGLKEEKEEKVLGLTEAENKDIRKTQRKDTRTRYFIKKFRAFLLSKHLRVDEDRAWEILYASYSIPFEYLVEKNPKIEYQGKGVHLSSKHKNQILHIYGLGTFEVKAVSPRRSKKGKRAVIKFSPSKRFQDYVEANVEVIDNGKE